MDFISKNIEIVCENEVKDYSILMRDIGIFAQILELQKIRAIEIYTKSRYNFLVAFLGAMWAKIDIFLLANDKPQGLGSFFNDEKIISFLKDEITPAPSPSPAKREREFLECGALPQPPLTFLQGKKVSKKIDSHEALASATLKSVVGGGGDRFSRGRGATSHFVRSPAFKPPPPHPKMRAKRISSESGNWRNLDFKGDFSHCKIELYNKAESYFHLSTSGSTKTRGEVIKKSLSQMICEAKALQSHLNLAPNATFISSASHQHLYGLTFSVFLPLILGAKMLDCDFNAPEFVLDFCADFRRDSRDSPLIFITSPTLLKYITLHTNLAHLRAVSLIISAGARLENSIRANIKNATNREIFEIYGSTESGVVAHKISGDFIPFSEVNLSLGADNRLIIASPWQKLTPDSAPFVSNDCARLENGALILLGRIDRIVKFHDKRVNLDILEREICHLEAISACAIRANDNYLACIVVLSECGKKIFLNSGKKAIVNAIKHINSAIRHIAIRENLPFNAQGKITMQDFIALFEAKIVPEFTIIECDKNTLMAQSKISESCFYFDGHFGDFPLVPGFIELGFVIDLAKKYLNLGEKFHIEVVKFSEFLRPFDALEVCIVRKNDKLYFHIFANNKECANGRIK